MSFTPKSFTPKPFTWLTKWLLMLAIPVFGATSAVAVDVLDGDEPPVFTDTFQLPDGGSLTIQFCTMGDAIGEPAGPINWVGGVPEPSTAVLAAAASSLLLFHSQRRRRR